MKNTHAEQSKAPVPPSAPVAGARRERDRSMPPSPKPVDPTGPEEYTWPRGIWNFGNVVFAISILLIVAILIVTWIAL